jgi:hypothetical protein
MTRYLIAFALIACGGNKTTPANPPPAGGACVKTGCSGTLCSDKDMVSTCEWKDEYACYKTATCARQPDGACGFTQTPELTACLAHPPPGGTAMPQ